MDLKFSVNGRCNFSCLSTQLLIYPWQQACKSTWFVAMFTSLCFESQRTCCLINKRENEKKSERSKVILKWISCLFAINENFVWIVKVELNGGKVGTSGVKSYL